MEIEHEARLLNINVSSLLDLLTLKEIRFCYAAFQKRFVYDLNPVQKGKWIRLRTDGKKTTLTYKAITHNNHMKTEETEILVSDFDTANEFLARIGFTPRSMQENFRVHFEGNNATYDIDFWPGIPPYLEIEAKSDFEVYELFSELGWNIEDLTEENVDSIYQQHGINLDLIRNLCFTDDEKIYLTSIMEKLSHD